MAEPFGRVALVTGASSGIGLSTAHAFARRGYVTVVTDVGKEGGRWAVAGLAAQNNQALFIRLDVSDEKEGRADGPHRSAGEIAAAVLWLCCAESSFTTGQAIAVDGGWTAK